MESALLFSKSSACIRIVLIWSRTVLIDETNISYTSLTITSSPPTSRKDLFTFHILESIFSVPSPFGLFLGLKTTSRCWSFVVFPSNFFGTKSSTFLHISHSPCHHILFCSGPHNASFQNELKWKQVDLDRSIVMILEVMPEWLYCFVLTLSEISSFIKVIYLL